MADWKELYRQRLISFGYSPDQANKITLLDGKEAVNAIVNCNPKRAWSWSCEAVINPETCEIRTAPDYHANHQLLYLDDSYSLWVHALDSPDKYRLYPNTLAISSEKTSEERKMTIANATMRATDCLCKVGEELADKLTIAFGDLGWFDSIRRIKVCDFTASHEEKLREKFKIIRTENE